MNEIDFRIKCKRNRLIITLIINKFSSRMADSDNHKYIIFVKIINVVNNIIFFFSYLKDISSHIVWLLMIFFEQSRLLSAKLFIQMTI